MQSKKYDGGHGLDFSTMPTIYWNNTTRASYLQRRIIIYSILYYQNNVSCVSDRFYDALSKQLVLLMKNSTPKEMERTQYWYAMYDFDGSTGFDLVYRLKEKDRKYLERIANVVYKSWLQDGGQIYM